MIANRQFHLRDLFLFTTGIAILCGIYSHFYNRDPNRLYSDGTKPRQTAYSFKGRKIVYDKFVKCGDKSSSIKLFLIDNGKDIVFYGYGDEYLRVLSPETLSITFKAALPKGNRYIQVFSTSTQARVCSFVTSEDRKNVWIWDTIAAEPRKLVTCDFNTGAIAVSPRGDIVAVARFEHLKWEQFQQSGDDKFPIHLYDVKSGKLLGVLEGHVGEIGTLLFTPQGDKLISISGDETLRIWDTKNFSKIAALGKEKPLKNRNDMRDLTEFPKLAISSNGKLVTEHYHTQTIVDIEKRDGDHSYSPNWSFRDYAIDFLPNSTLYVIKRTGGLNIRDGSDERETELVEIKENGWTVYQGRDRTAEIQIGIDRPAGIYRDLDSMVITNNKIFIAASQTWHGSGQMVPLPTLFPKKKLPPGIAIWDIK